MNLTAIGAVARRLAIETAREGATPWTSGAPTSIVGRYWAWTSQPRTIRASTASVMNAVA